MKEVAFGSCWRPRLFTALSVLGLMSSGGPAVQGQVPSRDASLDAVPPLLNGPVPARPAPRTLPPDVLRASTGPETSQVDVATPGRPRVVITYEGTASPGLRVVLNWLGSKAGDLKFQWKQIDGPQVALEGATTPTAWFIMPPGGASLRFVLVAINSAGVDLGTVTIIPSGKTAKGPEVLMPRADAGDDQIGVVGRQITLNGVRSEPRGQISYRWIQIAGAPVRLAIEDQYIFSFVPETPGLYRFALVVGHDGDVSLPDFVDVTVKGSDLVSSQPAESGAATASRTRLIAAVAHSGLASIDGGPALAPELVKAFESIADRTSLYGTFSELYSEMSRRLDSLIPPDEVRRRAWIDRFFAPLTSRLTAEMSLLGVDLLTKEGRSSPLSPAQQQKLAELFREIADGVRPPIADGERRESLGSRG